MIGSGDPLELCPDPILVQTEFSPDVPFLAPVLPTAPAQLVPAPVALPGGGVVAGLGVEVGGAGALVLPDPLPSFQKADQPGVPGDSPAVGRGTRTVKTEVKPFPMKESRYRGYKERKKPQC